ncbi:hypothetical protein [Streptomyces platensis]|uniref:hypothetical protein n=1 Tax=Streptomyces platensis TaxID=58346 RepID=UPI0037A22292
MADQDEKHTYTAKFRIPQVMWDAYGHVVGTRERGSDLVDHVRRVLQESGDGQALAALAAADEELAARRARKGGRPRRTAD